MKSISDKMYWIAFAIVPIILLSSIILEAIALDRRTITQIEVCLFMAAVILIATANLISRYKQIVLVFAKPKFENISAYSHIVLYAYAVVSLTVLLSAVMIIIFQIYSYFHVV